MSTSQSQIEANRANAQNSTGPATPEGKDKSCRNALKHGLFSSFVDVVGDQYIEEFAALSQSYIDDLKPEGIEELELVRKIVSLAWRLRRVERLEGEIIIAYNEVSPPLGMGFNVKAMDEMTIKLERLGRYEMRLSREKRTAQSDFHDLRLRGLREQKARDEAKIAREEARSYELRFFLMQAEQENFYREQTERAARGEPQPAPRFINDLDDNPTMRKIDKIVKNALKNGELQDDGIPEKYRNGEY